MLAIAGLSYIVFTMLNSHTLFLAQIISHLGFFILLVKGELFHWGIAIFVYFLTGCLGVTMTYHRFLSHRAWHPPKWFEVLATLLASLGLIGSALSWVAMHRKHHRYADTEKDPHSPAFKGFFYCQWLSMFEPVELRYVTDLGRQSLFQLQHKYYFVICGVYAGFLYFMDPFAIIYAFLAPACILWNAAALIVTWSHLHGEKPHSMSANARNSWLLGLLVWGEGWHNNHHHRAQSPYFAEKLWQIDVGGYLIWVIEYLTSAVNNFTIYSRHRRVKPLE